MTVPSPARETRIAEIEARVELATEGPWEIVAKAGEPTWILAHDLQVSVADVWNSHDLDAAFIANARADIPFLLAELTAALARAQEAERQRDGFAANAVNQAQAVAAAHAREERLREALDRATDMLAAAIDDGPATDKDIAFFRALASATVAAEETGEGT